MAKAVRKQFYLRPELSRLMAEVAKAKNLPEAEIMRQALEEYILKQYPLPENEPLASLAGLGSSGRRIKEGNGDEQ